MTTQVETVETIKVVLIDDDPAQRKLLTTMLLTAPENYEVFTASDGREGVALVRKLMPTIVLTDVMLPSLNGFELCSELRADEATADIPIIVISSRDTPEDRAAGLNMGADDYMIKPFSPMELSLRIRNVLRRGPPVVRAVAASATAVGSPAELFFATNPALRLAGLISALSLADLLHLLGAQSFTLRISGRTAGVLELRDGALVSAEITSSALPLDGLKAWLRLASVSNGVFELLAPGPDDPNSVRMALPLSQLLPEAQQYREEFLRLRRLLPSTDIFLFPQPGADEGLDPLDHRVLEAAAGGMRLDNLFDMIDATDLQVLRAALKLLRSRRLQAKMPPSQH